MSIRRSKDNHDPSDFRGRTRPVQAGMGLESEEPLYAVKKETSETIRRKAKVARDWGMQWLAIPFSCSSCIRAFPLALTGVFRLPPNSPGICRGESPTRICGASAGTLQGLTTH